MFVASRERRYLDALRGPSGEPIQYKRTGTVPSPDGETILDGYTIGYEGIEPVTIYLDAYHFDDELLAPKGFTCGAPIALAPPGPDLFQASRHLVRLALEQGAAREVIPIPLDVNAIGKPVRGVVLDHFRMMSLVVRTAAAAGKPIVLEPSVIPPDSLRQRTVVVAYPQVCEGRMIPAQSIELVSAQGQLAPRHGGHVKADALAALLPGVDVLADSIAATFGLQAPRANDAVQITYAEPCAGVADVTIPLAQAPLRPLNTPEPTLPAAMTAAAGTVRLQAQVDLDGHLHYPTYMGGPRELIEAAIQAVRTWTVDPVRVNGAPLSTPIVLQVRFRRQMAVSSEGGRRSTHE